MSGMMHVPVWCKRNFSFLEGASHPDELTDEAQRLGLSGVIFVAGPFAKQCPESAWIDDAKRYVTGQTQ